jgi:hypothetical protein
MQRSMRPSSSAGIRREKESVLKWNRAEHLMNAQEAVAVQRTLHNMLWHVHSNYYSLLIFHTDMERSSTVILIPKLSLIYWDGYYFINLVRVRVWCYCYKLIISSMPWSKDDIILCCNRKDVTPLQRNQKINKRKKHVTPRKMGLNKCYTGGLDTS